VAGFHAPQQKVGEPAGKREMNFYIEIERPVKGKKEIKNTERVKYPRLQSRKKRMPVKIIGVPERKNEIFYFFYPELSRRNEKMK